MPAVVIRPFSLQLGICRSEVVGAVSVLRWIGTVVVLHVTVNDVRVSAVGMDPERDDIGD
jgi:hypothetical protein